MLQTLFIMCFATLTLFSHTPEERASHEYQILLTPSYRRACPPYITGDAFRAHCDVIMDETNETLDHPEEIPDRSAIFVGPYVMDDFFRLYHDRLPGRYVLVTHNRDYPVPGPHAKYLDDPKLIAWFSQNVEGCVHPKLIPIPIGLGNFYTSQKDLSIIDRTVHSLDQYPKDKLVYLNLSKTHPERDRAIRFFMTRSFVTQSRGKPYPAYLQDVASSKYVISPRGNGLDCHRTWECLYLGAIPILKTSASDRMFKDLPVLIVKDWDEVTEQFLNESYERIRSRPFRKEKLYIDYWLKLIDEAKETALPPPFEI